MHDSFDRLARNLAGGMSRRKALWQFFSGLGVVAAVLTGGTARADDRCEEECTRRYFDCQLRCFTKPVINGRGGTDTFCLDVCRFELENCRADCG